jgi:hypothetical protein
MLRFMLIAICLFAITFPAQAQTKTDVKLVESWMMKLAGDEMAGRKAGTPESMVAAKWLAAEFEAMGLKKPPGMNSFFQTFVAKTDYGDIPTVNIVGYIPGSDPKIAKPYVMFGGHWDHIGLAEQGEDRIFNGADDNASGVITAMGVAKNILAGIESGKLEQPKRSLIFIAWGAEEIGLLGSYHYVKKEPVFPVEELSVYFNFELVGHTKTMGKRKVWMTGAGFSDFQDYIKPVLEKHKWSLVDNPFPNLQLFFRSDNFPFVGVVLNREERSLVGIPAHTFSTWGGEDHYHQVHDNPETIDFENLASFIDVMTDAAMKLANQPEIPKWLANDEFTFTRYQGAE